MKHSAIKVIGIGTFIFLFGAAAVVGGRLLSNQLPEDNDQMVILSQSGDVITGKGVQVETKPAAEMPATKPDVAGLFVKREDNSVFVGTGVYSAVRVGEDRWETHHDGPAMEVIITHDTAIFRDDTLVAQQGEIPTGPVSQILKASSLAEVGGENTAIQAWGERRGERLFATVLIFTPFA